MDMSLQAPVATPAQLTAPALQRGHYDEILRLPNGTSARSILERFKPCLPETYVDFDRKMRGSSLNHDLHGHDEANNLAVVQVRQAFRARRNHFLSMRKTYFLCGFNELTQAPFRHPVSANVVRAAIRRDPKNPVVPVTAAQCWIFGVTDAQLKSGVRQGDVFICPERRRPSAGEERGSVLTIGSSHVLRALRIVQTPDGKIWAYDPELRHTKGQHDPAFAPDVDQWRTIRLGREARTYDFAPRQGD